MSKCQKNKYAAGGKCGAMSNSVNGCPNPEISGNFAALLASRERQDAFLFSVKAQPKVEPKAQPKAEPPSKPSQAIVSVQKKASKSDIDTVLEGDF